MDCIDIFINLANIMTKKDGQQTSFGVKNSYRLDRIVQEPGNRVMYYLQNGPDRVFVHEELMNVSEDIEVPPEWVNQRK